MMQSFPHVEDYLELLSGADYTWVMGHRAKPKVGIRLARYDVSIVNNMADNAVWGIALTDRQADLAVRLILKYRKQFAKHYIDVSHIENNPCFRLPIRKIDRSQSLTLENGRMSLRFPYDSALIEKLREFQRGSQGSALWNSETKVWSIAVTEYNVNWIVTWALHNKFDISADIMEIYNKVIDAESENYCINLVQKNGKYKVSNAASSLQDYLDQHVGQDLIKFIDYAGVLGYTVSEDIIQHAALHHGSALTNLGTAHTVNLEPSQANLNLVFDYAAITNRYPVCIYDANMTDLDLCRFNEDEILRFDHNGKTKTSKEYWNSVKIVYARKIPDNWTDRIPLLISTAEMMYGGRRLDWINRAERIVYLTLSKLREDSN